MLIGFAYLGGGMKGVFTLRILSRLEELLGKRIIDAIDLHAGTSTGALIATGLSWGYSLEDIRKMYFEHGAYIFSKKRPKWLHPWRARYRSEPLTEVLKDKIGFPFGACILPTMALSFDDKSATEQVWKSWKHTDIPAWQVALSSAVAPPHFDPHRMRYAGREMYLYDGGIWAVNPAMAIASEMRRLNHEAGRYVISFGTGEAPSESEGKRPAGLLYLGGRIGTWILQANSRSTQYYAHHELNHESAEGRYVHLDTMLPPGIKNGLDVYDHASLRALEELADRFCDQQAQGLRIIAQQIKAINKQEQS